MGSTSGLHRRATVKTFAIASVIGATSNAYAQEPQYALALIPSVPTNAETIVAKITTRQSCLVDPRTVRLAQEGTTIRIYLGVRKDGCLITGLGEQHDITLGRFPPGSFEVRVINRFDGTPEAVAQLTVTDGYATKTGPFPIVDYTDHWWNPQESGWGLSIMQHPSDRLFAAWFVYDPAGRPVWYTMQSDQWSYLYNVPVTGPTVALVATGPIFKTTGPYYGKPQFDPNQVGTTVVGSGTLTFKSFDSAIFEYTVEGVTGSKNITRLPF